MKTAIIVFVSVVCFMVLLRLVGDFFSNRKLKGWEKFNEDNQQEIDDLRNKKRTAQVNNAAGNVKKNIDEYINGKISEILVEKAKDEIKTSKAKKEKMERNNVNTQQNLNDENIKPLALEEKKVDDVELEIIKPDDENFEKVNTVENGENLIEEITSDEKQNNLKNFEKELAINDENKDNVVNLKNDIIEINKKSNFNVDNIESDKNNTLKEKYNIKDNKDYDDKIEFEEFEELDVSRSDMLKDYFKNKNTNNKK